jgi:hypothetical protein
MEDLQPASTGLSSLESLPLQIIQAVFQYVGEPALFRTSKTFWSLFQRPLAKSESRALLFGADLVGHSVSNASSDVAASFRLHYFRRLLNELLRNPRVSTESAYRAVFDHPWIDEHCVVALINSKQLESRVGYTLAFLYGVRRERELRAWSFQLSESVDVGVGLSPEEDEESGDTKDVLLQALEMSQAILAAMPGPRLRNVVLDALSDRFPPVEEHCCCFGDCPLTDEDAPWSFAEALLAGCELGDPAVVSEAISRGAVWCSRVGELAVLAAIRSDHKATSEFVLFMLTVVLF